MKGLKHTAALLVPMLLVTCKRDVQWQGQPPIEKVSTETVPVQLQYRGTFDLGGGVCISNEFEGARMNGAARSNDTLITVLITPENSPVNMSPWYAFKIWSESPTGIYLKMTYPEDAGNRYYPKLSRDGLHWEILDSARYHAGEEMQDEEYQVPREITMELAIDPDTLWISAQELVTTGMIDAWISGLVKEPYVEQMEIGKSREGRSIRALRIGKPENRNMILVLSRQHPPEVTGFLAMQAFVEEICTDQDLAERFRQEYTAYVVPVVNPDGVDQGHWRHNMGGVDLNRDWEDFNQPETAAVRDLMEGMREAGGTLCFFIDFHSTQEDIFYTIDPKEKGNMPGLVPAVIDSLAAELPGYRPNIRPRSNMDANVSSTPFFFYAFGAEGLTYEVGDNTPRDFIRRKGEVTALKLMELMLDRP